MLKTESPEWEPSNSTMGNIENSAMLTVAELSHGNGRSAMREVWAIFDGLRRGPKEDEPTPSLDDSFF